MTMTPAPDILKIFEDEFPKDTVAPEEIVLSLHQFQTLLRIYKQPYARGTIYRWLKVSKTFLPSPVQDILAPAPAAWFICVPTLNKKHRQTPIIPLRYLTANTHEIATKLVVSKHDTPHVLVNLHSLKAHLDLVQAQVTTLISYFGNRERKERPHAQHRTSTHSSATHASGG
jgi:hypothetical protein